MESIISIETIGQLNNAIGYKKPIHPLISIIDFSKIRSSNSSDIHVYITALYALILKTQLPGELKFGRKSYDFQEGSLMFMKPGRVVSFNSDPSIESVEGWGIFFHPDLLRGGELDNKIEDYSFFSYTMEESLNVSDKEKSILLDCLEKIEIEMKENTDKYSRMLILSNIELMLNYCIRFYNRQFITRAPFEKDYVVKFDKLLSDYVRSGQIKADGLPSVQYFADCLCLSAKYFSDMLKKETGINAQEYIHSYILDKAKAKLLESYESVNEIAYSLGFEYPQYFSKLFKNKIGISPGKYRSEHKDY